MKTWFTADTHFGHARIIELAHRPYADVSEMNEAILDNINSTVPETDRLVILGDIVMGKLDEGLPILARIRAKEVRLIPGNHDRWSLAYHQKGDNESQARRREEARQKYLVAENIVAVEDQNPSGFDFCCISDEWYNFETNKADHPLNDAWFSHFPYDGDSHGADRHAELRVKDYGKPIIHGHVHEEWQIRGKQFNVGVDVNDFTPVHEDVLSDWVLSL